MQTTCICSANMSSRETSSFTRAEVEEKTVMQENRISRMAIIQITLSPWMLSIQDQIPFFFVLAVAIVFADFYRLRTASLNLRPLSS